MKREVAPALGAVLSREIQDRLAVYATPIFVHNSAAAIALDRNTFYVGLGGRARVSSTVYVVGEASPRLAGYAPGQVEYGLGIEKRAGAHVFQLTFANTTVTTIGQLAHGGSPAPSIWASTSLGSSSDGDRVSGLSGPRSACGGQGENNMSRLPILAVAVTLFAAGCSDDTPTTPSAPANRYVYTATLTTANERPNPIVAPNAEAGGWGMRPSRSM